MSEMFEAVEEEIEELFPPKKGGLVDRHRARKAAEAAEAQEAENAAEPIEQASYRAVKTAPESPEIISVNIVPVPAGGTAQVLPNSPYRYRTTLAVISPVASTTTIVGQGSATNPGAGGTVAAAGGLVPGTVYNVSWSVSLSGTVAAGDANNMQLAVLGLSAALQAFYPGVAGTYQQLPFTYTAGGSGATIKAIAAASGVAAVYSAQMVFTPVSNPQSSVTLAKDSSAALGGVGYPLTSGGMPLTTFSRAQLYAFNNGNAAVNVAALTEIYAPEKR